MFIIDLPFTHGIIIQSLRGYLIFEEKCMFIQDVNAPKTYFSQTISKQNRIVLQLMRFKALEKARKKTRSSDYFVEINHNIFCCLTYQM